MMSKCFLGFGVFPTGKYKLRPPVKNFLSVASQGDRFKCICCVPCFQPQAYALRRAVSKEMHQLYRKIGVYKMSNNWKVLILFYCNLLYTHLYAHIQNC